MLCWSSGGDSTPYPRQRSGWLSVSCQLSEAEKKENILKFDKGCNWGVVSNGNDPLNKEIVSWDACWRIDFDSCQVAGSNSRNTVRIIPWCYLPNPNKTPPSSSFKSLSTKGDATKGDEKDENRDSLMEKILLRTDARHSLKFSSLVFAPPGICRSNFIFISSSTEKFKNFIVHWSPVDCLVHSIAPVSKKIEWRPWGKGVSRSFFIRNELVRWREKFMWIYLQTATMIWRSFDSMSGGGKFPNLTFPFLGRVAKYASCVRLRMFTR